jgi:predicted nucleic acid-binding protein
MKKFVVDSCIFAKLFLLEEDREQAISFFITANNEKWQILVPTLFKSEFLNIIQCKKIDFAVAYAVLAKHFETIIDVVDIAREVMVQALHICNEGNNKSGYPSTYDATYHAIAMLNDCDFITADRKHYEKTKHLGHIKLLSDLS